MDFAGRGRNFPAARHVMRGASHIVHQWLLHGGSGGMTFQRTRSSDWADAGAYVTVLRRIQGGEMVMAGFDPGVTRNPGAVGVGGAGL